MPPEDTFSATPDDLAASDPGLGPLLTLMPPVLGDAALMQHLAEGWGLTGRLAPLTSERDLNCRLSSASGRYVAKLSNAAEPEPMTAFQTGALLHLERSAPALPVPRVVLPKGGDAARPWRQLPQGRLRVMTWLDGTPLAHAPASDAQAASVGRALAMLTRGLSGFSHPAADHVLAWDVRQFARLGPVLHALPDPALRATAETVETDFAFRIAPALARMPLQVCHADFNPHNLLVNREDPDHVTGILDFGDMVLTHRVCDVAVAASYQIDPDAPLQRLGAFLDGYAAVQPLTGAETLLLYDLILARLVTTLVISSWRAARQPGNAAYILRNAGTARVGLHALQAVGRDAASAAFAGVCGGGQA